MQTKQKPKITSHSGESFTKCLTQPLGMSDSRSQFDKFYPVPFPPCTGPPVRACHRSCKAQLAGFLTLLWTERVLDGVLVLL